MNLLDGLTDSQREAVTSEAEQTIVIAGAGAGKTRVLATRAAWLVREHAVEPERLMLLTFTRRAADQMRQRIISYLGGGTRAQADAARMTVGTFHSVSLRMLNEFGHHLGYRHGEPVSIYDEDDARELLDMVGEMLGLRRDGRWTGKLTAGLIERYRLTLSTTGAEPQVPDPLTLDRMRLLWGQYRSRVMEGNAVDFGLCLTQCLELLQVPEVREHYHALYDEVVVDEAQDSCELEHRIIDTLVPPARLFMVFDPRQNIYTFRGAACELAVRRTASAHVVHLSENFRSGRAIVEHSNRLIACNGQAVYKPMMAAAGHDGAAACVRAGNRAVVEIVGELLDEGYAPADIAVLARTKDWLRQIESELFESTLSWRRVGATQGLRESEEFKLVRAALTLMANPLDERAFVRLRSLLGVQPGEHSHIRSEALRAEVGLFDALRTIRRDTLTPLGTVIAASQDPDQPVMAALDAIEPVLGEYLQSRGWRSGSVLWPAIRGHWRRHCSGMRLVSALRWDGCAQDDDDVDERARQLTLATIHAVKGLEWPAVILVGACEETMPGRRKLSEEEIREERRVFYVGMTRPAERLIVVVPANAEGMLTPPAASRFVADAGLEIEERGGPWHRAAEEVF